MFLLEVKKNVTPVFLSPSLFFPTYIRTPDTCACHRDTRHRYSHPLPHIYVCPTNCIFFLFMQAVASLTHSPIHSTEKEREKGLAATFRYFRSCVFALRLHIDVQKVHFIREVWLWRWWFLDSIESVPHFHRLLVDHTLLTSLFDDHPLVAFMDSLRGQAEIPD